jgi:hypothetical protein
MPCSSHPPSFNKSNSILWRLQTVELFSLQFLPIPSYFLPLRSKYSHPHPVLKYSQYMFFPWGERPLNEMNCGFQVVEAL